ncbi:MAG: signal recognition particle-docking protein FtsY [Lachnospiraceae bacterium]|nr:signal recognition particle-docking protein FtsY [Lachnospiraceae bacterium]MBQ6544996.1 signal recognition particle-docking protein FtsY [Lachnospiraceae bacterium]
MNYFDIPLNAGEDEEKKGFFGRLVRGLSKTRANIAAGLDAVFSEYEEINEDFYEELEERMIMGDIGVETTERLLDDLREKVETDNIRNPAQCRRLLMDCMKAHMRVAKTEYRFEKEKSVIFLIGVNGSGKTTTAGKIAAQQKAAGRKVLLAAADTFRAAATEQLKGWAERAGVEIVSAQEGTDPASVVFDAVARAKARNVDVLICDTAGRLHNKKNLMAELHKMYTILSKEYPEAYLETLLVLDGTTGQNALSQAKEFSAATDITGIVLTKLDGTAKGGIAIAIQSEMGVPVKYIGVGEKLEDLQKFDSNTFVDALFNN